MLSGTHTDHSVLTAKALQTRVFHLIIFGKVPACRKPSTLIMAWCINTQTKLKQIKH